MPSLRKVTAGIAGASSVAEASCRISAAIKEGSRVAGHHRYTAHSAKGWLCVLTWTRLALFRIAARHRVLVPVRLPGGRIQVQKYPTRFARALMALGDLIGRPAVLWTELVPMNIVVNQGLSYMLDVSLSGGTQITSWYLLLISASPTVGGSHTLTAHSGWTEVTAYGEANRVAWVDGGESGQTIDNSGSPAVFTINSDGTDIGGGALASDNTKGGTTGTLFAAGAFTAGNKGLDSGDTLSVTAAFPAAAV